jgi:hypothetical protein
VQQVNDTTLFTKTNKEKPWFSEGDIPRRHELDRHAAESADQTDRNGD